MPSSRVNYSKQPRPREIDTPLRGLRVSRTFPEGQLAVCVPRRLKQPNVDLVIRLLGIYEIPEKCDVWVEGGCHERTGCLSYLGVEKEGFLEEMTRS